MGDGYHARSSKMGSKAPVRVGQGEAVGHVGLRSGGLPLTSIERAERYMRDNPLPSGEAAA